MPSGKGLDHVSMYGTDLSDEENAENMYQMFVNLPAKVIRQSGSLALMRGINDLSISKFVVFWLPMSYQDWWLKLQVIDLRH